LSNKTVTLQVPVGPVAVYEALYEAGNNLPGWVLVSGDRLKYRLEWHERTRTSLSGTHVTRVHATWSESDSKYSTVKLVADSGSLLDGGEGVSRTLRRLVVTFEGIVQTMVTSAHLAETHGHEKVYCPSCGREVPPGSRFCPIDGTFVGHTCPSCGTWAPRSARFCSSCGFKFA
jgi:hypothetical protein